MICMYLCFKGWIHLVHLWICKYFMDDSSVNFHDKFFLHFLLNFSKKWRKIWPNSHLTLLWTSIVMLHLVIIFIWITLFYCKVYSAKNTKKNYWLPENKEKVTWLQVAFKTGAFSLNFFVVFIGVPMHNNAAMLLIQFSYNKNFTNTLTVTP